MKVIKVCRSIRYKSIAMIILNARTIESHRVCSLYYQNNSYQHLVVPIVRIFWCYQILVALDMFSLKIFSKIDNVSVQGNLELPNFVKV